RAAVEEGEHLVDDGEAAVDEVAQRLRVVAAQHRADDARDLLLDDALDGIPVEREVLQGEAALRGEAGAAPGDDEVEEAEVRGGRRALGAYHPQPPQGLDVLVGEATGVGRELLRGGGGVRLLE